MSQISDTLTDLHQRFKPVSDTPLLDAQVLVAFVLGQSRSWLLAHPEFVLSIAQLKIINQYTDRIVSGEPLPYILGKWEFYGLEFKVTTDTLIPRPETEILVEHALAFSKSKTGEVLIIDAGTGSGCIAVSLAVHLPGVAGTILAGDISLPALLIARENARKHNVQKRIIFLQADLLPPLVENIDLLCANLPYIPSSRLSAAKPSCREPVLALNGGPDGLALVSRILKDSTGRISRGGLILLEIDPDAGRSVLALARECYPDAQIKLVPDLAGHDRMLRIQLQ